MAANSDGYSEVTTVVTCEGDLSDPRFPKKFERVVGSLNGILGKEVKVRKLEPWNSVRVTLSIPREAALRLRQLANEGSQQLRALGILSVQVEGDQIISLRIATGSVNSDSQEIILRTAQDGGNNERSESDLGLSRFLPPSSSTSASSNSSPNVQVQFKSPNVVCPPDSVVPKVGGATSAPTNVTSAGKAYAGPFPFASMNQAKHSNREAPFNSLPPPYPGKHPPVTISSPLLVNLLQNDGAKEQSNGIKLQQTVASASARNVRTTSVSVHKPVPTTASVPPNPSAPTLVKQNTSGIAISSTQASVLVNNNVSPSALSTNTSIRQNSTILTSTTMAVSNTPPLQYHRPPPATVPIQQKQMNTMVNSVPNSVNGSVTSAPTTLSQANSLLPQPGISIPQHPNQIVQTGTINHTINHMTKSSVALSKPISQPPAIGKVNMPLGLPKMVPPAPLNKTNVPLSGLSQPNKPLPQPNIGYNPSTISNPGSIGGSAIGMPPIGQPSVALPTAAGTLNQPSVAPNKPQPTIKNMLPRSLPSPPPYSVAISRPWDSIVHSAPLLDITPTLADLKPDDLDELLPPTLERDLADTLLADLPDELANLHNSASNPPPMNETATTPSETDNRKFLINPLTGELEPQPSDESDTEELKDVFTGLPSPAALSDDDTSSTIRPDATTDQSDSETRQSDIVKTSRKFSKARDRGRDSPAALKPTEKIKLRLKLEKSEPINPAYKVDVSFINTQPKKASSSIIPPGEELRVPPLHISLRGRNSVVIKNKSKFNPDGTPKTKVRKTQDHAKVKKNDGVSMNSDSSNSPTVTSDSALDQMKSKLNSFDSKKIKKLKTNHENKDIIASLNQENDLKSKLMLHSLFKEKQKERRGSDSELVRSSKKYSDSNGMMVAEEKKRRLSQSEQIEGDQPAILGSTNIGTIASLPQKPRKEKVKAKEGFKMKDASRNKIFSSKNISEKASVKHVVLPTSGEIDMEAKFKQGLLEGTGEKGVPRPPHRTEVVHHLIDNRIENNDKVVKALTDPPSLKDKSPEPDKCNTPDRKSTSEIENKSSGPGGGRSPTSGSAGQGEDSGIESMDALSEKSPNQASQSPHADLIPATKTKVPDMLYIEAELAKMEGLNGDSDRPATGDVTGRTPGEDVNENEHRPEQGNKMNKCCELTCVLQDSIKQNAISTQLSSNTQLTSSAQPAAEQKDPPPLRTKKEELDPLPVRVTPALYTYSNPDKSRGGSESPSLSDDDSNSCSTSSTATHGKTKSLLEQLLIEIPNDHQAVPSSPSPATRSSVRTRALSKMGSPELSSPVPKQARAAPSAKRKRNESDSSNHSVEDVRNKKKKHTPENSTEAPKNNQKAVENQKANNVNKKTNKQEESSDSDEPLIEKLRKNNTPATPTTGAAAPAPVAVAAITAPTTKGNSVSKSKAKGPAVADTPANNNKTAPVSTRRSVRSNMPAQNTRSKGEKAHQPDADILKRKDRVQSESERRKTRSAVSEVDSKRKKEVK